MSDNLSKSIRDAAIDDCVKLIIKWRDDYKDVKTNQDQLCFNILSNLTTAIVNLKKS